MERFITPIFMTMVIKDKFKNKSQDYSNNVLYNFISGTHYSK